MIVSEGWTTGVFNRNLTTVNDDVLIFNPDQLQSMGITEKEGLDLVMTHEEVIGIHDLIVHNYGPGRMAYTSCLLYNES